MTPKERLEKIISKDSLKMRMARFKYGNGEPKLFAHEELINLPVDFSVGRKTPKSEYLLKLESNKTSSSKLIKPFAHVSYIKEDWQEMISVYTGSDLGHFNNTDRE